MNRVTLMGRFTRDPEITYTPSGTAKLTGQIATSEKYKDKTYTEYHRIVVWGRTAEVIQQYFNKGDGIYVEGRLTHRSYEQDNQTKYITEVVVLNFEFPPGKSSKNVGKPIPGADFTMPEPQGDIPF